jgi:hypothetical protein
VDPIVPHVHKPLQKLPRGVSRTVLIVHGAEYLVL